MTLPSTVAKHLGPNEEPIALARCEPLLGPVAGYLLVTDRRLLYLRKTGLWSWDSFDIPPTAILGTKISQGLFRSSVTILVDILKAPDGITGPREFTFPYIPTDEATRLVGAINYLTTEGYPESMAYRTKRCPDCDELVKARARVCKHCGHQF
jgi:hypothetical protein